MDTTLLSMNKSESIRCTLSPPEVEIEGHQQSLEIKITAMRDLFFDKSLLGKEQDYWIDVIIPYGNGEEALTIDSQNIQLVAPESWIVDKLILDDGKIYWRISNEAKLGKGDTIALSIRNVICNSVAGQTTVTVGCLALSPVNGDYITVSDSCSLPLLKTYCPVIFNFTAKNTKESIPALKADGFTEINQLLTLDSIAVMCPPYAVDPPSPHPRETKEVTVSWVTQNAAILELSDGGQLSEAKGTKNVSVDKSLSKITLSAFSTKRTFVDRQTSDII